MEKDRAGRIGNPIKPCARHRFEDRLSVKNQEFRWLLRIEDLRDLVLVEARWRKGDLYPFPVLDVRQFGKQIRNRFCLNPAGLQCLRGEPILVASEIVIA
ncbi:hypothetical protein D9M72_590640 [compost metagenome]